MPKSGSVLLLSGGIDSAVCLALEVKAGRRVIPLFFDYAQPQLTTELARAEALCEYFCIESPRQIPLPPLGHNNFDYPMRNLIFISLAANMAFRYDVGKVITGIRDSIYLDTSYLFIHIASGLTATFTNDGIEVRHPIFWLDKQQVIRKAKHLGIPFDLTYSCIRASSPCGECPSCKERKKANV